MRMLRVAVVDQGIVPLLPTAIAWIEERPEVLGCVLHLVDGSTLTTEPVHGDPSEMADRVDRALADDGPE